MSVNPDRNQHVLGLNEAELRDYFKKELDCPLEIRPGQRYHLLLEELIWLWKDTCGNYEMDCEAKHIYDDDDERDFQLSEDDYDELRPLAISLSTWIEDAKAHYIDRVKPITVVMADSKVYAKHFPHKKMTIPDLKLLAIQKRAGYFFPNISVMELDAIMIKSMKPLFKQIIEKDNIRYGVKYHKKIGVTVTGEETEYLIVEINKSSGTAHCYPCSEQKARSLPKFREILGDQLWYDGDQDERSPKEEVEIDSYVDLETFKDFQ